MDLKFVKKYKSIQLFNDSIIKEFSIFLGVNGAGKTHLLKAILDGSIKIDGIDPSDMSYFNLQTFLIKNQRKFSPRNIDDQKLNAWNIIDRRKFWFEGQDKQFKDLFGEQGFPYDPTGQELDDSEKQNLQNLRNTIGNYINKNSNNDPRLRKLLRTGIFESGKYASEITQKEFFRYANYEPDEYELLQSLSEVFLNYQKQIILGGLRKKDGGNGLKKKDIDELEERSPWAFINKMFQEFGLPHTISHPQFTAADLIGSQSVPFQVKLNVNGEEIDFEDLSSGEKILCALAITVYQDNKTTFPKLVLLDEVDASLHPSMIEHLLNVIQNVFVENGCNVILATHSPTTVALATEESLFEIKQGVVKNKINSIPKVDAIELLSEGYMTIDAGVKIFDAIFKKKLTIISEGKNQKHIKKALEVLDKPTLKKIQLYEHDACSGDADLLGLFEFIKRTDVEKKVLFVWDCDSKKKVNKKVESEKVIKFCFEENKENNICRRGIENLYPKSLFTAKLIKKITIEEDGKKKEIIEFPDSKKNDFLDKVLKINDKDTFEKFQPLLGKIKSCLE